MMSSVRIPIGGLARPRTFAACLAALTMLIPAAGLAHEYKIGTLVIDHPWSRATPAKVAVGYFVVRNEGDTADRLLSATADVAETVEFHDMKMNDGVMTMRALPEGLEIPPGAEVALKPGGLHLMMLGLKRPLEKGQKISGTLTFQKAGTVPVEFAVEAPGAPASDHEHKGH